MQHAPICRGLALLLGIVLGTRTLLAAETPTRFSPALSKQEAEEGFVSLFNGKDLTGWQGAIQGYRVEDGVLVCPKGGGGNLLTQKQYGDFVFRFEFRLTPGANNGVGIRTPPQGNPAYVGMEIQILDDGHPKYQGWLKDYQCHGSIYGVVPAKRGFLKPAGQWNSEEIYCKGRRVKVTLNGTVILDADLDEVLKKTGGKTLDGADHPGLKRDKGHLGFLGHGDHVEFRNLRIKEL